jgi:hypothetical protein
MTRTLRTTVVAVAALACTLVAAGPASAAPSDPAKARTAITERLDKRLAALKKFGTTLTEAKHLDAAHKTALSKLVADQTAGITTLRAKVQGETTREALKADARSMIVDFRVFLLTGPKVRLTAAIDAELAAVDKLREAKGADAAKLDAVEKSLDGQVDKLLALQPGPDGDALRASVKDVRQAAKSARASLKTLRKTK